MVQITFTGLLISISIALFGGIFVGYTARAMGDRDRERIAREERLARRAQLRERGFATRAL